MLTTEGGPTLDIFDEFTVSRLDRRYGRRAVDRPLLWHVATGAEFATVRNWIAVELATMDERGAARLAAKLRDANSFIDAFHELCVAALLRDADHSVAYEPDLHGVTPDLLATKDGLPLLAEVWTRNRPDTAQRAHRQWLALQEQLERIPVAVRLVVVDAPGERPSPSDSAAVKRVVRSVREWLMSPLTQPGVAHTIDGYTFAAVGRATGPRVQFGAPGGAGGWSNSDQFLGSLAVKVSRYRDIAGRLDAELLVVTAAGAGAAMSREFVADTLAGKNVTTMAFTVFDIGPIGGGSTQMRADEDPPSLDPALSAVGWLEADVRQPPGRLAIFRNPAATRPLRPLVSAAITEGPAISGP